MMSLRELRFASLATLTMSIGSVSCGHPIFEAVIRPPVEFPVEPPVLHNTKQTGDESAAYALAHLRNALVYSCSASAVHSSYFSCVTTFPPHASGYMALRRFHARVEFSRIERIGVHNTCVVINDESDCTIWTASHLDALDLRETIERFLQVDRNAQDLADATPLWDSPRL